MKTVLFMLAAAWCLHGPALYAATEDQSAGRSRSDTRMPRPVPEARNNEQRSGLPARDPIEERRRLEDLTGQAKAYTRNRTLHGGEHPKAE